MAPRTRTFDVLVVGAGVAGLEAAVALRELTGDSLPVTMAAPDADFDGARSKVSEEPLWHLPGKIAARYLGPYLEARSAARIG
jgi:cation diffusion facilitator CzcD-associated flavoprotein CzcO